MKIITRVVLLIAILFSAVFLQPPQVVQAANFPAQMNKSFTPISIVAGGTSVLSVTIYNPNSFELTSAHYHDLFPVGITVSNPLVMTNSCGGSVLNGSGGVLNAGETSFQLTGGTVPRQIGANPGECTITVEVTSTTPGNQINTIPANELESEGDDGGVIVPITNATPASATLQVSSVLPPSLSKSFSPNTIAVGSSSILTINISNNDPSTTLTETTLTDYLPTNLVLASSPSPTLNADCGTGTLTALPGATSLTLNNAQIGSLRTCTFTVNVTSVVQDAYTNTIPAGPAGIGSIQTRQGVTNASSATANLNVQAFTLTKAFSPASIPAGGTSTLRITIRNQAGFPYTGVGFFDDLFPTVGNNLEFVSPASVTYTDCGSMTGVVSNSGGGSTVNNLATFSGGTIAAGATCQIDIVVRAFQRTPAGSYTNTIPAGRITTTEGATNDQPVSSTLGVTGLSISKSFVPNSIPLGGTSILTITITNPSPLPYSVNTLLDDLSAPTDSRVSIAPYPPAPNPSTTCTGGTVSTAARSVTLTGGTIPALGSCTITVTVVGTSVGSGNNRIPAGRLTTIEGGTNAAQANAPVTITNVLPTSSKDFNGVSGANQIVAGGTSNLTITITNPAGATALTNLGFIDNLASTGTGLVFTSLTSNTCGGSVTGAGTQVITLSGGSLAGGSPAHSCSVVVLVTMPLNTNGGTVTNTIFRTDITNDQNLRPAANITRTLVIRAVDLQGKTFTPSTFQSGGTSSLVITLQNFTGTPLTVNTLIDNLAAPTNSNLSVADYPPATPPSTTCNGVNGNGVVTAVAGTQLITLTGGTIAAGTFASPGTCTVTIPVTGTAVGTFTNTIPIGSLTTMEGPSSRTQRQANVTIYPTGAGVTLAKTFGTNPVNAGSNSLMTLTISAPADTDLHNFSITDAFPANMVVGNPTGAQIVSGCGALTFTPAPITGDTAITATGGTVTRGTNCILRVNVRGNFGGSYTNTIHPVNITNTENRSIPTDVTQTLTVNTLSTLAVTKNFQPPVVNPNGLSTLTIYLENSNTSTLINATLTDNLPGSAADGVVVAPTPNASTTCGAGVITANPGASIISMTGGTIPAKVGSVNGLCSIRVNVQGKRTSAALPATYNNNIPVANVSARNQDTGEIMNSTAPAAASLTIATLFMNVVKGFDPLTVFGGSASTLSVRLINPNNATLSGITFTDNMPAGMIIANPPNLNVGSCGGSLVGAPGASSFTFSGGSLSASTNCTLTLSATMVANGNLTNTIYAGDVTTFNGASNTQPASATLTNLPGASVSKFFAPNPIYAGQYSLLTITIQNTGNIDLSGMGLIDDLASTGSPNVLIAGGSAPAPINNCGGTLTADPGSQLIQLENGVLPGSAFCTLIIPVTSTFSGNYQNTIPATELTTNEGATNALPARDTLIVLANAALGDFVWNDLNANGIQDSGEPGINNVTVHLLDSGGNTISTTTTDASGFYHFTNLTPGTYSVQFVAPAGYNFSPQNVGSDDAIDSDANTTTGITGQYTLISGETNNSVDAGLYLQSPALTLVKTATPTTYSAVGDVISYSFFVTNSGNITLSGSFTVTDDKATDEACPVTPSLAPGASITCTASYTITPADLNAGFVTNTASAHASFGGNPVNSNTDDETVTALSALGDFVWNDLNANGIQDAGEPGINNVTVHLLDSGGNTIATTTTNATGFYQFTGLTPGTYAVQFVNPGGYTFSPQNVGSDNTDSDANPTTGITPNVTLVSGENNPTIDAGLYQPEINVTKVLSSVTFTNPDLARMTYTITIGPNAIPLTAIQAEDDLEVAFSPQIFSIVSLTATNLTENPAYDGLTASDTNLLTGTDSLNTGETGVITLVVDLNLNPNDPTATYVNTVIASGLPPTGPRVTDSSSATGPLFADPAVTKTGDPTRVFVGELVTFTITVTNNGNQTATDVVVTDPLPSNMSVVSAVSAPTHTVTIIPPRTVQVDIGDMDPDDVVTITIVARVNSTGTPPIINQVELTTTSPTDFDPNNRSSITLEVLQPALPETGFAPGKITRLPDQAAAKTYALYDDLSLSIPSLQVSIPIIGVPASGNSWDVTWLENRAGWLNGTAYPTWNGNSVLTGHVYLSNGLPGPFLNISKLKYGDHMIINAYGKKYIYEVRSVQSLYPDSTASVLRHEEKSWITLLTCKDFNENTDSYNRRMVVRAVLVGVKE
jgi:LPXTG-site transpeptidase (sortase) family protein